MCLGTSDAFGSLGRHNAGYLLETQATRILLDSGPGILTALKAQDQKPASIDAIIISHLHGDHFAGIPFLLLEFTYQSQRRRPLKIIGPPGIEKRVMMLCRTLYADLDLQDLPFPVRFIEMEHGSAHESNDARIESFRVPHQEKEISLGHRIIVGGSILTYSGDTPWTDDLIRESSGSSLFLCECTSFDIEIPRHIHYAELEKQRTRLECAEVLLTHMGSDVRKRSSEIDLPMADDGLALKVL